MTWVLLGAAIACELGGTMALRVSEGLRHRRWIPVIAVAYLAAIVLLGLTLARGMPVGVAYGIWAACGVALTAVIARLAFGDPLTKRMGLGIALIAVGVLVVELGAQSH